MLFAWFLLVAVTNCLIPSKDFKPDVYVLTDISNEPDDAESLVRLLVYSNELNIKGIGAITSYWLNDTIHDEDIYPIYDAYKKVQENLLNHSSSYPTADYFRSITHRGHAVYGLAALNQSNLSDAAVHLIEAADSSSQNLYVLLWGGANVLAEALNDVRKTRCKQEADSFIEKLVVYSISDQDNAGPWIRRTFPEVKYIASVHGFNMYGNSAWVGISGDVYNFVDRGGPNTTLVTHKWTKENVQSVGPLGEVYPTFEYNMEGDTPSTLFVLPNGLSCPYEPSYGSWGGRYTLSDLSRESGNHYGDALDYAIGVNNETYVSNKATIWKWREDFQNDFAARMQWTVNSFDDTVHQPIIVVNGSTSYHPTYISAKVDDEIILDASNSYDLNNRPLIYKWYHYREPTLTQGNIDEVEEIEVEDLNDEGSIVSVAVPSFNESCYNLQGDAMSVCKSYHIILEVTNDGDIPLKTYKRFVLNTNKGDNEF